MKKPLLCLPIVLLLMSGYMSTAAFAEWITFVSEAGRFSVLMPGPGEPVDKASTINDAKNPAASPYTNHIFVQRTPNGVTYLVGWTDYKAGFRFDAKAELAANRDNFVKGFEAKLASARSITLGANPGIEFVANKDDGRIIRSRIYIVGVRPYMLVAISPKGVDDSATIQRFLDSFKLK